jgi:site-specific recombinase XerD
MGAIKDRMMQDLAIRGLSENTQQIYLTCVKQFVGHFMISPERLGLKDIRAYQLYLIRERNVAESSFNVHVAALKFLFGITLQRNWNLDLIPYHRKSKRLPVVLSREEIVQLYQAVSSLKHKAIVLTLYSTGLRVSELVHLKVHDIDSSRMLVRVQEGKNGKDRYVGLSPKLLELLRQYWRSTKPPSRTWLFPGDCPGHPLTRCGVSKMIGKAKERAGIHKPVSAHTLRHSFATHLLESGVDVRRIQLMMGHGSLRSTVQYLHVASTTLHESPNLLDLLDIR